MDKFAAHSIHNTLQYTTYKKMSMDINEIVEKPYEQFMIICQPI